MHDSIRLNPKQWITNRYGHVLLVHRSFTAAVAAGCYGLVGGTGATDEQDQDVATRLLRHRVGLEVDTTVVDRWWQTGHSGATSIRSLLTGTTNATVADLVINDETIQSANFYPLSQVVRIARRSVTDSTLVAMCRMLPELVPPIPDEPTTILFDLGLFAEPVRRADADAVVAEQFGVDAELWRRTVDTAGWPLHTGLFGNIDETVRQLAAAVESPRGHSEHEHLVQAWIESQRLHQRDGVQDILSDLRGAGLSLGLVADATHGHQLHLERLPATALFDRVVLSVQHGRALPDPALFRTALADLGYPPSRCLYLTNRAHGLIAAAAAGIAAAYVGDTSPFASPFASVVDPLAHAFPAITNLDRIGNLLP